jgi:hypothetical protein
MNPKKMVVLIALLPLVMLSMPHSASADISGRLLRITYLKAFKYTGFGPLDVVAQVTDEYGTLVSDATLVITYDRATRRDRVLKSSGKGLYVGCDIDGFLTFSNGMAVMATASRKGMEDASAKAQTVEGDLCGSTSSSAANVANVANVANIANAAGKGGADQAMPRLVPQKINAAKPDGKTPLDISLVVTDQSGKPVTGAKVLVRATDFNHHVDVTLVDRGNGIYSACAIGMFDTKGAGAIRIHVSAQRPGYQSSEADADNVVGALCSNVLPVPPPNANVDNAAAAGLPAARTEAPALAPAPQSYYYNFEETTKPWGSGTDTFEPTALVQGKDDDGCTDSGHHYALLQSFKAGGSRPGQALDLTIPQPIGTWMQARLPAPKAQAEAPVAVQVDFAALNQSQSCEGCILAVYAGNESAVSAGQFRQAGILPAQGWQIYHAGITFTSSTRADATYVAIGWFGYDASIGLDCVNITLKQPVPNGK